MISSHFNIFPRRGDEVQEVSLFFVGRVGEEYDLYVGIRGGWKGEKGGEEESGKGGQSGKVERKGTEGRTIVRKREKKV